MWEKFTSKYSLSKTLRFELKPVGETAERIEDFKSQYLRDTVLKDEQRAKDYQAIKKLIDDYHREYIESCLAEPVDKKTGEILDFSTELEEAFSYYQRLKENPVEHRKAWESVQEGLRKKLVTSFVDNDGLFKKEFITRDLPDWLQKKGLWEEHRDTVESFKKFTTYFAGFHENRKNMYKAEDQSTAIANRLMNENLPKFFSNCLVYKTIKEKHPDLSFQIDGELLKGMGVESLDDIFQPHYFINLFAQSGIDNYQELLGGRVDADGAKTQGLNEQINLYRQQNPDIARGFPRFAMLYKQILSDREAHSFIPDVFEDDKQLLEALKAYISEANEKLLPQLKESIEKLPQADLDRVYIKSASLASLSQEMFHFFGAIPDAIRWHTENNMATKKERERFIKQDVYALADVDSLVSGYISQLDADDELRQLLESLSDSTRPVLSFLQKQFNEKLADLAQHIEQVKPLLELEELSKNRRLPKDDNDKGGEGFQQAEAIREMLDAFMEISHAVKSLRLVKGRKPIDMPDVDSGFYAAFAEAYEEFSQPTISLYNKARNHLTKKLFSKDKVKLNFEETTTTLLNGWDANKEIANGNVLLEKDGLYYLGIFHPKHKKLFDYINGIDDLGNPKKEQQKDNLREKVIGSDDKGYRKIVYKLLPGASKMLPKVFFSAKRIDFFEPSKDIIRIRNTASHTKGGDPKAGYKKAPFSLTDCHLMIDFFKSSINKHPEWKTFGFKFSPTKNYTDISDFYREVEHQGYQIGFHHIKKSYINQCVREGKLFLFQIYNKDFSPHSKGRPNLHTLYWKGLFEPENLKDVVLKLNGEAEMFYRKHSIKREDRSVHKANEPIDNKNKLNPKKQSCFEYDIIKDRRYTQDKFFFHVPISLNFKAQSPMRFNDQINSVLAQQDDVCVIGIDRGERHLLYYTVVNSKGEIIEQGSLNKIETDQGYPVDYQQKLDTKEKERDKARKTWSTIENIKELKVGYLSQVVHKLAQLIIKHNAVVCLEALNFGFKRGRFKVEKQVYQKFEKALIDKLNYLVFKEHCATEPGGYMNAYQLASPFVSFEKLGKQTGILYYVRADYTSKIDPATGFVDFLKPKYESLLKSKTFFESFDGICFNADKGYFEFAFDYKKLTQGRKLGNYQTKWAVCTFGDTRHQNRRNKSGQWETEKVDVTVQMRKLFEGQSIDYEQGGNIKDAIAAVKDTKFYKKLYWLLRLTLSLRHSVTGTDEDFILSPVANEKGEFFDSRKASSTMPQDADANGAYHIALKGLWNLQQIRQHDWDEEKPKKLNLAMENEEWFGFAQNKQFKQ